MHVTVCCVGMKLVHRAGALVDSRVLCSNTAYAGINVSHPTVFVLAGAVRSPSCLCGT
jgi:hypothetical protein